MFVVPHYTKKGINEFHNSTVLNKKELEMQRIKIALVTIRYTHVFFSFIIMLLSGLAIA